MCIISGVYEQWKIFLTESRIEITKIKKKMITKTDFWLGKECYEKTVSSNFLFIEDSAGEVQPKAPE